MESLNGRLKASQDHPRAPESDLVIMGVPFWNAGYDEFQNWWVEALNRQGSPAVVLFANAHTLTLTRLNRCLAGALRGADVVANDGVGVRIAARMRGAKIRENLNGTDLIPWLLSRLDRRTRVFLYGGEEPVNMAASIKLGERYPNVEICGRIHGFVPEDEAIAAINQSRPDLVLVGTGHPHQELFCARNRDRVHCSVLMSCGALFAFVSGTKPRAPMWMRKANLEWFHRLLVEPRRLAKRYLVGIPVFLLLSAASIRSDRRLARILRSKESVLAEVLEAPSPAVLTTHAQECKEPSTT